MYLPRFPLFSLPSSLKYEIPDFPLSDVCGTDDRHESCHVLTCNSDCATLTRDKQKIHVTLIVFTDKDEMLVQQKCLQKTI